MQGCLTCKSRRIKCDRGTPKCTRCIRSERPCVFADAKAISIHSENTFASGRIKRPRGPRAKIEITPPPDIDIQQCALFYYLNHQLEKPYSIRGSPGSVQENIPQWTLRTKHPIVTDGISSLALAVFSQAQQSQRAKEKAYEVYETVLQQAQANLESLVHHDMEAALLVIFLMSRFEDSMHNKELHDSFKSYSHHDGAVILLQIWQQRQIPEKQPAGEIIKHSRRGIIRSMFLRHRAVPIGLEDGAEFGEVGLELEYDRLLVSIASLRQRSRSLLQQTATSKTFSKDQSGWAEELISEAETLEAALANWSRRLPNSWMPRRVSLSAHIHAKVNSQFFFSPEVVVYNDVSQAFTWLHYHATTLLLIRTRLRVLQGIYFRDKQSGQRQKRRVDQCTKSLQTAADSMISSLPFALGRIKTVTAGSLVNLNEGDIELAMDEGIKPYTVNLVFWPLSLAVGIDGLDPDQKQWLQSLMRVLCRVIGAGVCESIDDFDRIDL
jgi:hypothetical protein